MKKILLILITLIPLMLLGQTQEELYKMSHDPKAKELLDKSSALYSSKQNVYLYFLLTINNTQDKTEKSQKGELYVEQNNRYRLVTPDQTIFCDGQKIYDYNKNAAELYIYFYDPQNPSILSPQMLTDYYKKGFKYYYDGQIQYTVKQRVNGKITSVNKKLNVINLYPEQYKKYPYSYIRIWLDVNTNQIIMLKYKGKNGIDYLITILETKYNTEMPESLFRFNKANYPSDIEIEDFTQDD